MAAAGGRRWAATITLGLCLALAGCGSGIPTLGLGFQQDAAPPSSIPRSQARISFAPITGAPAELLMSLERSLTAAAAGRSLTVVPYGDPSETYVVRGYLSAVTGASGTVLVHVWDVTDAQQRRLHRISGQEIFGGSSPDPWTDITAGGLYLVAIDMVESLNAWLDRR